MNVYRQAERAGEQTYVRPDVQIEIASYRLGLLVWIRDSILSEFE